MIPLKDRKFGWVRDTFDPRDFTYQPKFRLFRLPKIVDLRDKMPPIYDQRTSSSCTSHAWLAIVQHRRLAQGNDAFMPSRLFHYWTERVEEGTTREDKGAMIRTGIKVLVKYGVCHEDSWLFDLRNLYTPPSQKCYSEALGLQALEYERIEQKEFDLLSSLADGHPFVMGIKVYESFMSDEVADTGAAYIPKEKEHLYGGHAIVVVGYNKDNKTFLCRNSWGKSFGMNGYFSLPFDYVLSPKLSSDMWKLTKTE